MRVLHLFANWKWTGPAEPAVNLASTLSRSGLDVHFACGREVKPLPNYVAQEARSRGLEPILSMRLRKHRHPIYDGIDRRGLRSLLQELRPDVVHCHLNNDHRIAIGAANGLGIPIVRSLHDGDPPRVERDTTSMYAKGCAGLITISERMQAAMVERFGLPADRCRVVEGAVDLRRFDPTQRGIPKMSEQYGIEPGDFVVGIVARMQKHRRFEIFFEGLARVAERVPELKVLLVGRGTLMDEVAVKPAARKELAGRVIFTGYRRGAEFVGTLACMDAKVFLTPGSDGSCRAVREAMAMGVPVVAARRGHLVDMIDPGRNGFLIDDDPDQLADRLIEMAEDRDATQRMSAAAAEDARTRWGLAHQASQVRAFYDAVLAR